MRDRPDPIDAFLQSGQERPLTEPERRQFWRTALRPVSVGDPANQPYRVFVTWRLVRAVAHAAGLLGDDEMLSEAFTETDEDRWYDRQPLQTPPRDSVLRRDLEHSHGPLLPQRLEGDLERRAWVRVAESAAREISVWDTEAGRRGASEILNVAFIGLVPSPVELLRFEELLVRQATVKLSQGAERELSSYLTEKYGLSTEERLTVTNLARARAVREHGGSIEEQRAMLAAHWKDLLVRARQEPAGFNFEATALKELAKVLGVTRAEPEDDVDMFARAVRQVAQESEEAMSEDPADEEALRDFDREQG